MSDQVPKIIEGPWTGIVRGILIDGEVVGIDPYTLIADGEWQLVIRVKRGDVPKTLAAGDKVTVVSSIERGIATNS